MGRQYLKCLQKLFIPLYTDTMPMVDALLPGLEITPRQVFEEAELT